MGVFGRAGRALVRADIDPRTAAFLKDLERRALQQSYLDDAARMDEFYGRVPAADPLAGVRQSLEDPIADMVAATGAPRRWLESADYQSSIARGMDQAAPPETLADMLLRNDRTAALVQGRLDRLAPDQRASSLGLVARQAVADQAAARRASVKAAKDRNTALMLGAAGGLGAGAFGARMAMERQQDQKDRPVLSQWSASREAARAAQERARTASDIDAYEASARLAAEDGVERAVAEIDLSDDTPVPFAPGVPDFDTAMQAALDNARIGFLANDDDQDVTLTMDTPEQAVAIAPGPAGRVIDAEQPRLTPQQSRTLRVLINAGMPYDDAVGAVLGKVQPGGGATR